MIKPNEIRIANWFNLLVKDVKGNVQTKLPFKVKDGAHIDKLLQLENQEDYFEPIPLTPEILEKCGFGSGSEIKCDYHDMVIEIINGEVWLSTDDFRQVCLLEWLHKFQNIYFDFTGEELNINL